MDRGLAFLGNTQNRDGSFGDSPLFHGNLAVSSLAGLALLAGGHVPGRGAFGNNVLRAIQFVLSKEQQKPPGFLKPRGRESLSSTDTRWPSPTAAVSP